MTAVLEEEDLELEAPVKIDAEPVWNFISVEALQAMVDYYQRDMELPAVIPGVTPMSEMNYHPKANLHGKFCPGCTDNSRQHGTAVPMKVCKLDKEGKVVLHSGAVVTDPFVQHLQKKLIPKIIQQMHRAHQNMSRSLNNGRGEVDRRSKVLPAIPETDW